MNYVHEYDSPLGRIIMESDGRGLTCLRFEDGQASAGALTGAAGCTRPHVFDEAERWLDIYFSGREPGFIPRLSICSTVFRQTVWDILLTIPYGRTKTYGEIADRIAERMHIPRMSAQAVGGAAGHNPVALIIPCHRVVGSDGSLTGYAGGIGRKAKLLELEKAGVMHRLTEFR